jgi:transcriptional regulator with XRE-family HTH domain
MATEESLAMGIRMCRARGKRKQEDIARETGVTQKAISRWELGTSVPAKDIGRLADALNLCVWELLGEQPVRPSVWPPGLRAFMASDEAAREQVQPWEGEWLARHPLPTSHPAVPMSWVKWRKLLQTMREYDEQRIKDEVAAHGGVTHEDGE